MKRILIIPDVHGRDFWKDPVYESLNDENIHIVFLGDFTDTYSAEWDPNGISGLIISSTP